ncbi:hypothetical protein [Streptomyces sp.]
MNRSEEVSHTCSNIWRSTPTMTGLRSTIAGPGASACASPSGSESGSMIGTIASVLSTMIIRIGRVVAVRTSAPSLTRSLRWARA